MLEGLEKLQAVLSKKLPDTEVQALITELMIASGKGAVAIEGDASEAVIITGSQNIVGDNNRVVINQGTDPEELVKMLRSLLREMQQVDLAQITGGEVYLGDRIYQGANAEAIQRVFQDVLDARHLRTLLTHNEFTQRVEQVALTSYQGCFVGREVIRQELQSCLDGTSSAIILHGSGGLGKTRLLLALPDIIPKERSLWYIRNEAESVEPDIASLSRDTQHIIVVDDAHRFSLLYSNRQGG